MASPTSRHRSSTPGIMQELSPSPVEETPDSSKNDYFPTQSSQTTSSSSASTKSSTSKLGLSGHSKVWWLTRTQKYSSYAFSAFVGMHALNTALIPLATRSVPASDTYLLLTRPYYQSFPLEPLLITLPLLLHIGSGLALRLHRRRVLVRSSGAETRSERHTIPWPKVSGTSALGFALTPLVLSHAFVNRGIPLLKEGGSSGVGLGFVAHGFARHPALAWLVYAALVGVGSWHVVWGWARWMGADGKKVGGGGGGAVAEREKVSKRRWWLWNGVAALVAGLWAGGGLGVIGRGGAAGGWKGKEWDELYKAVPVIGGWM